MKLPLPPGILVVTARHRVYWLTRACIWAAHASGALTTLHNNPDDFHAKYFKRFPGYYHTGDTGHIDEDGYVYVSTCRHADTVALDTHPSCMRCLKVMARTDDVINVAGHRITTGSIEEVILSIPEVIECAVVRPAALPVFP